MGKYLNLGNAAFASIRKSDYVDKSGLIKLINETIGTKDKLTCVSRPRRFGKSFTAQMLCAYYDRSCDSRVLFSDLEIAQDISYEKYLNKYDVIYLDITWFISIVSNVKETVQCLQREVIDELKSFYPEVGEESSLPIALAKIHESTNNKFIIIIDEWDALFREAKTESDLQKEFIQLLRALFKRDQTDKMIEAAYMTGVLPIKKYGTQSALTDFREYSMISPKRFAEYVGFTEQEVKCLCDKYEMNFEEAKKWYYGYSFHKLKSVYSPNSVMQAMKNEEFATYWTETETYESLKIYIDLNEDGLKEALVQMLGGAKIAIDAGTFQNDMTNIQSRDDVLTLLVHLGYLAYDSKCKSVYIPNEEVRQEFIRAVKSGRHSELVNLIKNSDYLLEATINGDSAFVADAIESAHCAGTSPLFYNNEQALRSVIRFAYISCIDEYAEIQELPSGNGYADIVYLPKKGSNKPALLIELKWNKTEEGAIGQIRNKDYPQVLKDYGGKMLLVGINYDPKSKKHTCKIETYLK